MSERQITVGFTLTLICFPLRESSNWLLGWHGTKTFSIGPMRFRLKRETARRND
jgi:hypothetical protein